MHLNKAERITEGAAAIKRAIENLPVYPEELLRSLGANLDRDAWMKSPQPNFRGWNWSVGGYWEGLLPDQLSTIAEVAAPPNIRLTDIRYMGMWRSRFNSTTHAIYCAIPGLESGEAEPGSSVVVQRYVSIGEYTQAELDEFVRKGWDVIQKILDERGRYEPRNEVSQEASSN